LIDVVENGTAQRLKGAIRDPRGTPLIVAGKTGTGDHRRDVYGAGGRLIESRVLNRTATFAFMLGERFFGAITAFVSGPEAARYRFTSALPVQVLKSLAPILEPVIARGEPAAVRGLLATKDSPSVQAMIKGAHKG
ncbi:MAG: glycosyl transferase family 51, partial [Gammaproteobacteria bacterium]